MAAKNAIVLIRNKGYDSKCEYRINHCGNIEELYNNDIQVIKDYIRDNFIGVPINKSRKTAIKNAIKLAHKELDFQEDLAMGASYLEYGIIEFDRFQNKYFEDCI